MMLNEYSLAIHDQHSHVHQIFAVDHLPPSLNWFYRIPLEICKLKFILLLM
jgi:hypothetical protein